jgi:hypothetical protein
MAISKEVLDELLKDYKGPEYSVPLFVQTRYTEQGERIWQSSNDGRRSASLR